MALVDGPLVVKPRREAFTDANGWYLFYVSRTGIYIVEARKDGYLPSDAQLAKESAGEVDFALVPAEVSCALRYSDRIYREVSRCNVLGSPVIRATRLRRAKEA